MKMTKVRVLRGTHDGSEEVYVNGYVGDDMPGLAVHRSLDGRKWWDITHLASGRGRLIPYYMDVRRLKDACEVARTIAQCGDWGRTQEQIMADRQFRECVAATFREKLTQFHYPNAFKSADELARGV